MSAATRGLGGGSGAAEGVELLRVLGVGLDGHGAEVDAQHLAALRVDVAVVAQLVRIKAQLPDPVRERAAAELGGYDPGLAQGGGAGGLGGDGGGSGIVQVHVSHFNVLLYSPLVRRCFVLLAII